MLRAIAPAGAETGRAHRIPGVGTPGSMPLPLRGKSTTDFPAAIKSPAKIIEEPFLNLSTRKLDEPEKIRKSTEFLTFEIRI